MITFDQNGNPNGAEIIDISLSDFKKYFVDVFPDSSTRKLIWIGYEKYIDDFSKEAGTDFKHWIGGAFASAERDPSDIDVVILLPYFDGLDGKNYLMEQFQKIGGSREEYRVDAYLIVIYPDGDSRFAITREKLNYWKTLFALDRKDRPRSFFQLSFGQSSMEK